VLSRPCCRATVRAGAGAAASAGDIGSRAASGASDTYDATKDAAGRAYDASKDAAGTAQVGRCPLTHAASPLPDTAVVQIRQLQRCFNMKPISEEQSKYACWV
jgi:hypothetical protein